MITSFVHRLRWPGGRERRIAGVAAPYQISKFEVTLGEYAEFLNAVAATDTNDLHVPDIGLILQSGPDRLSMPPAEA